MSNVTLSQSLKSVVSTIESALAIAVAEVEAKKPEVQLTVTTLVDRLAPETGLDKQLLQLAISSVINGSDSHHIVKGRYGGIKEGARPEPVEKKPSEMARLKAELEAAKAQLAQLQTQDAEPATEVDMDLESALNEIAAE